MPNRTIKDSICTSENLEMLSAEAERLFYRLLVQCDDYGLMIANPNIIKCKCFPLRSDAIKEKQMFSWLAELETAKLIFFYEVDGRKYLKFTKWERHQQSRAQKPKYPLPERGSSILIANDIKCKHVIANVLDPDPDLRSRISIPDSSARLHTHPTVEEVTGYCQERGNTVDAQRFVDYYTANGWKVGRNPMKDWKATVRTWEKTAKTPSDPRGDICYGKL